MYNNNVIIHISQVTSMKTRSQSRKHLPVNIEFDEASRAWNLNKRKLGNGEYSYVCGKQMRNGRICQVSPTISTHICSATLKEPMY